MQVGDLVKWTYPGHEDHGVVVAVDKVLDGYVNIAWCLRPEHNGPYPSDNEYLKLIQKNP
tara:strand:- start:59 stop:238 length:180 start_codon:yes stop_codon:yes gene_type:complete